MINKAGFTSEGNWYKGNLHCHTDRSDGKLSPAEAVRLYRENGYHFLCISDHELYVDYQKKYDTEDFVLLPGTECSVKLMKEGALLKTHHIHGILGDEEMLERCSHRFAAEEKFQAAVYENNWNAREAAQKRVDSLVQNGCLVVYNHPLWSKVRQEDFIHLQDVWGMEIYNHSAQFDGDLGIDTRDWDAMLEMGKQVYGVAADDNHNFPEIPDSCGGWIVVKARTLSREEIVFNMKRGNFYASTGPQIYDWGIRDGVAYVECSPCEQINFICGGGVGYGAAVIKGQTGCRTERERREKSELLCRGEYRLKGRESYIRVECVDRDRNTAWSNAIFI